MPVPLPNLDDRTFDDLAEEGRRLISSLALSWTDHNPSDPGITFIELFAFLTEMLIYRADLVSVANKQVFVRLLRGDPDYPIQRSIDEEIRLAVLNLRDEERAVTLGDFQSLAESVPDVGRAHCLPRRNVESSPLSDAPAHISLLIVPRKTSQGKPPVLSEELRELVRNALVPRCLLTTRLHIAQPAYLSIAVNIKAYVFADQNEDTIKELIKAGSPLTLIPSVVVLTVAAGRLDNLSTSPICTPFSMLWKVWTMSNRRTNSQYSNYQPVTRPVARSMKVLRPSACAFTP